MRRAVWLVLAAAGCNQVLGVTDPHLHDGGGAAGDDAGGTHGSGSGGGGLPCTGDDFGYTISNVASCDIPFAATDLPFLDVATSATIDTTAGMMTVGPATIPLPSTALVAQTGGGPQVRVVALTGLDVPSGTTVHVVGQYALVLVVQGDVSIEGVLLASADHTTAAAGSRGAADCGASAGVAGMLASTSGGKSSSGGGGGGHGSAGATGGAAALGAILVAGGGGGVADTNLSLQPLRGGCPGGAGAGATPAAGGGAIQISASGRIDLSGTLAAGGGGGVASSGAVSAPAGGSGGGLLLEAATIAMTAKAAVTANGGGGADITGTSAMCSGENGHPSDAMPAAGGSCSSDISGGAGGTGTAPAHGGDASVLGTGGGGAVGRIAVHSHAFTPGIVSPSANVQTF